MRKAATISLLRALASTLLLTAYVLTSTASMVHELTHHAPATHQAAQQVASSTARTVAPAATALLAGSTETLCFFCLFGPLGALLVALLRIRSLRPKASIATVRSAARLPRRFLPFLSLRAPPALA